jgi:predicted amino acid-binding ACT domain protein
MARSHVLVTVTGPDRPGITSRLTGIIAGTAALLLDIEQKPLREKADSSISTTGLDAILYLLGISAEELQDVIAAFG